MTELYTAIDRCRSCHSSDLTQALDLGQFALSDFFDQSPLSHVDCSHPQIQQEEANGTFKHVHVDHAPLVLVRCGACSLVQLQHTVDRDRLYASYWYRSSTQPAMVTALQDVVRDAQSRVPLRAGDMVLDIGANDGTLLEQYPAGVARIAFEPARNLWDALGEAGATIAGRYFPDHAQQTVMVRDGFKIITSVAMFYDVADPNAFVAAIKANLAADGVWINQLAYLPETLAGNNMGDIVHEHLTFWTVAAFANLLKRHGLLLWNWSHNDVNGGSVRFVVTHDRGETNLTQDWADPVGLMALRRFGQRIRLNRSNVRTFLHTAKRDGKLVVGYAAATKFNTALQYWDIGPDLLPAIADRNPTKWGKFTPTGQIVVSEQEMRDDPPDYLLCGAYHFLDAFMAREAELMAHGTQWVVPFPTLQVIGGDACPPLVEPASARALAS